MKFSRILPLVASISTIALVAACARHEKSPKISKETMELQAVKTLRDTYGNVDIYDPSSIALAKQIDGADLLLVNEVNKDDKAGSRDVEVDIHVLMKDRADEMVAHGVISHQGLSTMVFKTDEKEYSMTARCHAKDCANIVVELTKMKEKPAVAAAKGTDASGVGSASAQVEQQAELRTAPAESAQAADAPSASTEAAEQAAAQTSAPTAQPQGVPSSAGATSLVLTPDAKAYLQFRVPLRDVKAKESLTARTQRQATFNLFWSSPTQKGDSISGTTKSVSLAMKDRGGKTPTAPAAEGETNANTPDQSNENAGDTDVVVDKGATGTQAPVPTAAKPAAGAGQAAPTLGSSAPKAPDAAPAPAPAKPGVTAANPTGAAPQVQAPAPTRTAAAPSTGATAQAPQASTRGTAAPAAAAPKPDASIPEIVVTATHASMAKAFTDGAKELEAKAAKEKDATKKAKLLADAKVMRTKAAASQAKADAEKKANEKKGAATMAALHTAGSD